MKAMKKLVSAFVALACGVERSMQTKTKNLMKRCSEKDYVINNSKSFISVLISIVIAYASIIILPTSASNGNLNLHISLCSTELTYFSSISSASCLYGTYGVPASFNTRLPQAMQYVHSYYSYHAVNVNYTFNTSAIINTPAAQSASIANNYESRVINGCNECNDCSICAMYGIHHNHTDAFLNALPSYNPSNEVALMITASIICTTNGGYHALTNGINGFEGLLVRDIDYKYANNINYESLNRPYMYLRSNIIHEMGHLYNVADHYGAFASPTSNPNCIWGEYRGSTIVASNCTTCSVCSSTIYNNHGLYNHT